LTIDIVLACHKLGGKTGWGHPLCGINVSLYRFVSIQSYNSRSLHEQQADRYDYVVVDEFHHEAAPSYERLLDHVQPRVLLGLTATPERSDGLDVLR